MSHLVTIQTKLYDAAAISAACQRLNLPAPVQGTVQLYSGEATGLIVQLPGWVYPAVVDTLTGVVRYDVYRQPPPRINHYEVVAVWTDAKAFDAHETAAHTLQFRAATAQGGRAWRANLYDQRLYKAL